jgi:hypothetical protein
MPTERGTSRGRAALGEHAMHRPGGMHDRIEGLKHGLLAGAAGLGAMQLAHRVTRPLIKRRAPRPTDVFATERAMSPLGLRHLPDESPTAALARIAYQRVAHRPPPDRLKPALSWAVHAGYGLLVAALYGALRAPGRRRRSTARGAVASGALFGLGLWLVGDELAVPLLGLADRPTAYHPSQHAQALVEHLAYGVAAATTARALGGGR